MKTAYETMLLASLITVRCCREWEVTPLAKIGRCGLCGKRPT